MTRTIGLFGGTFDPIHCGHVAIAGALRDELSLDEVRLLPTGIPPHRPPPLASDEDRRQMVELAIEGEPGLKVDARELSRGRYCYTVETLAELRAELGPDVPLVFLIGGDSLATFHTWHDWRRILDLSHLAVALRPGTDLSEGLHPAVAALYRSVRQPASRPTLSHGNIYVLSAPPRDISATDLRARLRDGAPTDGLLPEAVRRYIFNNRLYRD